MKPHSQSGLSMLELVVAFGIFFLASSFLMGTFAFGSRIPVHAQRASDSSSVAQELLDERLSLPFTTPIPAEARTAVPGQAGYEYEVLVRPATFDPAVSLVTLTVYPPSGNPVSLNSVRPPDPTPNGEYLATSGYDCFSCHSAGSRPDLGPGGLGPALDPGRLRNQAANAGFPGDVEGYIRESIRDPEAYESGGWAAAMQSYPDIVNMPDEDLDAIIKFVNNL
jgi:type II secretory pathway pseudopilin PulG